MAKGIDVSKWQGAIDWRKVKNDGVEFAIMRVWCYGKDPYFEQNYANAKAVGVPIGAYIYSYALNPAEAKQEALSVLECLKDKQFEYPIYFDIEEQKTANTGKANCTEIVKAFCSELEKNGYFVGVYANTNWLKNYLDYTELSKLYTIWKADYREKFDTELDCDIHQYTSSGKINGINGNVDLNNCTRDFAVIKAKSFNGFKKNKTAPSVKKGDKVTVLNATQYNGKSFKTWGRKSFDVMGVKSDKILIGDKGVVTCWINVKNIKKL